MIIAILKITDLKEEQMLRWNDIPAALEKNNSWHTALLIKCCDGYSGDVMNDIKKACGLARRAEHYLYGLDPKTLAECLITATMKINSISFKWSALDEQPVRVNYSYLLKLDLKRGVWSFEGERPGYGIFLLDEWKVTVREEYKKHGKNSQD